MPIGRDGQSLDSSTQSLMEAITQGRDARGFAPHHGRDQKRYANQYAGSITWIGRYGSAATV